MNSASRAGSNRPAGWRSRKSGGFRQSPACSKLWIGRLALLSGLTASWTFPLTADGGLGSIAALRPILLALAFLAIGLLIWLVFSLALWVVKPGSGGEKRLLWYKVLSFALLGLLVVSFFLGSLFMGGFIVVIFLALLLVGAGTAATLARTRAVWMEPDQ